MANVFIAYANVDRNLAQLLAAHLEAEDRTIWWDTAVLAGEDSRRASELESARKVVVLWSTASTASPFVLYEAIAARDSGKLVQVKISSLQVSDIPRPFRELPLLDVSDLASIASAVSDRAEIATELPVQVTPSKQGPLGRLDESQSEPTLVATGSDADMIRRPDLTVPHAQALGTPPPTTPTPTRLGDEAARQSNRLGNGIFALAAALVAVADIAIFWYYGVFDGLSGLAAKLLALLTRT